MSGQDRLLAGWEGISDPSHTFCACGHLFLSVLWLLARLVFLVGQFSFLFVGVSGFSPCDPIMVKTYVLNFIVVLPKKAGPKFARPSHKKDHSASTKTHSRRRWRHGICGGSPLFFFFNFSICEVCRPTTDSPFLLFCAIVHAHLHLIESV